ncbi:HAD family phosphatase [Candidatus Kaiserbacteria bacterium]|nr:MAG: HAD family phosphatase [Candidatus Kaiserbacteria bacterium]
MQKVAFFDIDGTVFRSSLFIEVVEGCIKAGVFPKDTQKAYAREYHAWQNREGSYEAYVTAVVEAFMEHIRGVYYGDFADVGRSVVTTQGKQTYRYTRDLIQTLRAQGYFVVAISQSPKTILDEFCAAYGFDKVYGRIYELGPRDLFTGVVNDVDFIANKAKVIERVLEKEGLTLEDSIGVGDTESDIPLLESVAKPICFNPNQTLYRHAQKKGWQVIVERKDVIYTL